MLTQAQTDLLEQITKHNRLCDINPLILYYEFINAKNYCSEDYTPLEFKNYNAFILNCSLLHRLIIESVGQYDCFDLIPKLFDNKPIPVYVLLLYEVLLHYQIYKLNLPENQNCYINFACCASQISSMLYTWDNFPLQNYISLLEFIVPENNKKIKVKEVLSSNFEQIKKSEMEFEGMLINSTFQYYDVVIGLQN